MRKGQKVIVGSLNCVLLVALAGFGVVLFHVEGKIIPKDTTEIVPSSMLSGEKATWQAFLAVCWYIGVGYSPTALLNING
ncbi:MAG: hypothetical protein JEZ06_11370 [Anaerolineaceae bacterium]|nr:hypothetical protein [Anaerolineaceae bacterium]